MKTIVIYRSKTGFTKRYARWIAEAAGAECVELSKARKKNLDAYEAIVFGGGAYAGRISGLSWFKGNMDKWNGKQLIVFCVGANPADRPEIEPALKSNFQETELQKIQLFYCPGGLNYEKMSALSRLMMKFFVKTLQAKKNKTRDDEEMIRIISSSYDISDKKYIKPILSVLSK